MSLQYYRNPFVRNEHQPKIPDAKMDTSVGARVTRSFEFQMGGTTADPNGTSNYEEMYIFSLPGISSTVVPFRYNAGTPDVIYTPDQKFAKFEFDGNDVKVPTSTQMNRLAAWRGVSFGVRITPISPLMITDGYYEVFSIPMSESAEDWSFTQSNGTLFVVPSNSYVNAIATNFDQWRDAQSYKSGNLHELSTLQFRNLIQDTAHTPISPVKTYSDVKQDNTSWNPNSEFKNFLTDYIDPSFQITVFRLRCAGASPFLLTQQYNLELQYGADSALRALQTENSPVPRNMNAEVARIARLENVNGVANRTDYSTPTQKKRTRNVVTNSPKRTRLAQV